MGGRYGPVLFETVTAILDDRDKNASRVKVFVGCPE
jgi:hypothetical protein